MSLLYLLGTGTPTPTKWRFGTSYVLQLKENYLMFDCGPATTYKLVKTGLFPTQIDYLFFTHHHSDHDADYPCFLLCRWDQSTGKEQRLQVYGPQPTEWITERLIGPEGAFCHDLEARLESPVSQSVHENRGGSLPRPEMSLDVSDIRPGKVIETDQWTVTTAPVRHAEPWLESIAYRVDSDEGSIMFTGDTGPCESVSRLAEGVDVLVVNCWDHQETMEKNGEAPGQTGTLDAANMAQTSGAKKLILTHTGPHLTKPGSREKGIGDIARIYKGEVIFGEELMSLVLW
ncbi:MAG: MBL fold metallo-hydrolase [Spirochaetes bacterium]|nr:MBL fold metallo-hydrolase [Spirochaetota bacterium]